jgi:exodeoxyribonuclease VII large subunit
VNPQNGLAVLVRAQVSVYEPRGDFQLIIEHMESAGEGLLRQRFEELKQRLMLEGLFDPARKKPLPLWPRRIGVVTSPTGAAIRDILHILKRRAPAVEVIVYPVPVQGAGAAPQIAQMIALADARHEVDVLIIARGGGSLEDLWAFNEEIVARAVSQCSLPTLAGVGHEIDVTICDAVADVRAPTPSGAAELAVGDQASQLKQLKQLQQRLQLAWLGLKQQLDKHLTTIAARLQREHPQARVLSQHQTVDELSERLRRQVRALLSLSHTQYQHLWVRLHQQNPAQQVGLATARLQQLSQRLSHAWHTRWQLQQQALAQQARTLQAVSPLATLERGYSIIEDASGQIISSALKVQPDAHLSIRFKDGKVSVTVQTPK